MRAFAIVLNACSHSGEAALARDIWRHEIGDAAVQYDVRVMTALIDCVARRGLLTEACVALQKGQKGQGWPRRGGRGDVHGAAGRM